MRNFCLFIILFIASCNSNSPKNTADESKGETENCNSLPATFTSYNAAVTAVESADFSFTDKANTSKSSWIRAARYYSCNNIDGFFFIETDRGNYLHQGVPVTVWESFKQADSFGSFYNANIKHQYRLLLN
ncbi:MAG: KTSC domain-containing protein [Bacteroidetes bacterium]|nr:KTSC domain-containing protein [Bacteroidota bacterium]